MVRLRNAIIRARTDEHRFRVGYNRQTVAHIWGLRAGRGLKHDDPRGDLMTETAPSRRTILPTDDGLQLADPDAAGTQDFGDNPTEVRESDHYVQEYVTNFVEKWDELIDWRRRAQSEGSFFVDQLKARGVREVLDVATGTGYHSVRLLDAGFDVVSADGSPEMLAKAFENGRAFGGHVLRVVEADWRWLNRDVHLRSGGKQRQGGPTPGCWAARRRFPPVARKRSVRRPSRRG